MGDPPNYYISVDPNFLNPLGEYVSSLHLFKILKTTIKIMMIIPPRM